MLFDTHAHLNDPAFDPRPEGRGLDALYCISSNGPVNGLSGGPLLDMQWGFPRFFEFRLFPDA